MTKAKKVSDPHTPDKAASPGDNADTPSKVNTIQRLLSAVETLGSLAASQKTTNLLLMKKLGLAPADDLADFQISVNYVEQYSLSEAKVEKVPNPLTLQNTQVVLEPSFVILVWEGKGQEFNSLSLSDSFGVDGPFIISYRNKLKEMWPDLTEPFIKEICSNFKILANGYLSLRYQLESLPDNEIKDTEARVKSFFETHHDLMASLRKTLLEHHIAHLRSKLGDVAADKFAASMGILAPENNPVNATGAIKSAVINMSSHSGGRQPRVPRPDRQRQKRTRDEQGRQACERCGEMVPHKGFKEHNLKCTKKKT